MSAAAAANAAAVRPAIDSVARRPVRRGDAGAEGRAGRSARGGVPERASSLLARPATWTARPDKFRDALRMDSEFFSAAFYLGACYAAGGKDRDAAGAWQTSLITESNAPFVYTLLGDALLRLRDMDQAIDVLTEARTLWPADDEVTMRLGTALVMANKPADALKVLAALPRDAPGGSRAAVPRPARALRGAQRRTRRSRPSEADRALFVRYADAYAAAKGPQQALVAQWRKYIEK